VGLAEKNLGKIFISKISSIKPYFSKYSKKDSFQTATANPFAKLHLSRKIWFSVIFFVTMGQSKFFLAIFLLTEILSKMHYFDKHSKKRSIKIKCQNILINSGPIHSFSMTNFMDCERGY
jgi:hypothetical protein